MRVVRGVVSMGKMVSGREEIKRSACEHECQSQLQYSLHGVVRMARARMPSRSARKVAEITVLSSRPRLGSVKFVESECMMMTMRGNMHTLGSDVASSTCFTPGSAATSIGPPDKRGRLTEKSLLKPTRERRLRTEGVL